MHEDDLNNSISPEEEYTYLKEKYPEEMLIDNDKSFEILEDWHRTDYERNLEPLILKFTAKEHKTCKDNLSSLFYKDRNNFFDGGISRIIYKYIETNYDFDILYLNRTSLERIFYVEEGTKTKKKKYIASKDPDKFKIHVWGESKITNTDGEEKTNSELSK